jgi:hypothetical protein
MVCRLKIRVFQIVFLVCMVLFLASVAQAGSSQHHHHGNADVVSPFESVNKGKPLHCILNMHQHFQNIPCPHQNQKGKKDYSEWRSDCGTNSGSANTSSTSLAKDLSKKTEFNSFTPFLLSSNMSLAADEKHKNLPRSIDHPPQLS